MAAVEPMSVPKVGWSRRMAGILASSIALPLVFEILLALIGDEQFNFTRAGITVVVVGVAAGLLYIARPGWLNMQRARATFLVLAGVGSTLHGFMVTALPDVFDNNELVQDVVGMATLVLGVTTFAVGCFYFRVEDIQEVAENPATTRVPDEEVSVSTLAGMYQAESSDRDLLDACRAALSAERLHYIAFYEPPDGQPNAAPQRVFSVDTFSQAKYRLRQLNANQRREAYHAEGERILQTRQTLSGQLQHLHTGPLVRLVLDVEQGAIYYYEISREPGRHLIAVTLDQNHVYTTDAELEALKGTIRRSLGLPRT